MVRAPCCEKMGLKKGTWTIKEDQILFNYVTINGHENWRAIPKQAGLLRCGKSCRLRWVNYLRPDIKRGNLNREEEKAIIELHELLGNRWSAIAAKLPGRTDNEIKNVWHTHLKKRAKQNETKHVHQNCRAETKIKLNKLNDQQPEEMNYSNQVLRPESPHNSEATETSASSLDHETIENYFPGLDVEFWSEILSDENSDIMYDFSEARAGRQVRLQFSSVSAENIMCVDNASMVDDVMGFWCKLFNSSEKAAELPEY